MHAPDSKPHGTHPAQPVGSRPAPARVSVILPCFNEAACLRELLPELSRNLDACCAAWEVVLVDDGSVDATAAVLAEWARRPCFMAVLLSRNFGKEAALTAGLDAASGNVVVLMDADGQHPPALIGPMVERWQGGADMVYAARASRAGDGVLRRAATRLFYRLVNIGSRCRIPANAGDFLLMDRAVVEALRSLPERTRLMKGLYAWVGFRKAAVPYDPPARRQGVTRFGLLALAGLAAAGVTAFTTWPLRLSGLLGTTIALAAFGYGAFLVVDYLAFGTRVSGWTTIVVLLVLLGGIQLLSLGLMGEYIGRIFDEVKGRPLYLVRERLGAWPLGQEAA